MTAEPFRDPTRKSMPDLRVRGLVSVFGGALFVAIVVSRPAIAAVLFAVLAILGSREQVRLRWSMLQEEEGPEVSRKLLVARTALPFGLVAGLLAVAAHLDALGWLLLAATTCTLAGVYRPGALAWFYPLQIVCGFLAAALLRFRFPDDPGLLLAVLLATWACDIGAYLVGCRWGRTPFAPSISPKKSWEGAIGGFAAAVLVGFVVGALDAHPGMGALFGAVCGTVGPIGDLVQSRLKRRAGAKDSGTLFPGHGGVLDRFDSFLVNTPICWLLAERFW